MTYDTETTVGPEDRIAILHQRLGELANPIPSTKGMGPKDRADRLHAELQRRILIAREAIRA